MEKIVPMMDPLNPPTAAASVVITDKSAGAEAKDSNLVQQLLSNHAEPSPTCEPTSPSDILNRVAGADVVNSIAKDETGRRECEADNSGSEEAEDDQQQIGSYHATDRLDDSPCRLVGIKSSIPLRNCRLLLVFLLSIICYFCLNILGLEICDGVFLRVYVISAYSACCRPSILRVNCLQTNHTSVRTVQSHEFKVVSLLDDFATVHNDDIIGVLNSRQAMSNSNDGAILCDGLDGHLDTVLARRIKRCSGLIKDKDLRIANQGSSKRKTLSLATAHELSATTDKCAITILKPVNESRCISKSSGLLNTTDEIDHVLTKSLSCSCQIFALSELGSKF
ncbi:hypothetical protein HG530_000943 [Fusarium avenaceum]|nr:hypothetical protein HG530_000943 [Fusarium avenaceum]